MKILIITLIIAVATLPMCWVAGYLTAWVKWLRKDGIIWLRLRFQDSDDEKEAFRESAEIAIEATLQDALKETNEPCIVGRSCYPEEEPSQMYRTERLPIGSACYPKGSIEQQYLDSLSLF